MSLSSIDFQIRSLPSSALIPFMNVLIMAFGTKTDLDLAQSYLVTFLRIHRENLWTITEDDDEQEMEEITLGLEYMKKTIQKCIQMLKLDVNQNMAVLQWIKAAVVQIC